MPEDGIPYMWDDLVSYISGQFNMSTAQASSFLEKNLDAQKVGRLKKAKTNQKNPMYKGVQREASTLVQSQ